MHGSHEYSILGHSRANFGRHLGTVAAAASGLSALVAPAFLAMASKIGFLEDVPSLVLWPLTAGAFYILMHWLFDRYMWRWSLLARWMGIPNLSGQWACTGQAFDAKGRPTFDWVGEVTIHQTWEKIKIYLRTDQSSSSSCIASICPETEKAFRLVYSYRNEPVIGENILMHMGFSEMLFDRDASHAEGEYYNVKGRLTKGRMTWIRN